MTKTKKQLPSLLELSYADLKEKLSDWGEPSYRADQIWQWLYQHLATDFAEMTNLSKRLREKLAVRYCLWPLTPVDEQVSRDKLTRKVLFALPDGNTIETVLMHYHRRHTVCVSTQVGCPIGCAFCATGRSGFARNLTAAEIIAQVLFFARELRQQGRRVTNIVLMGMGEPLLNYEATWQAITRWTDERGFNLGARHITLSTVGHVPGIRRLSREPLQIGLAISLHAPTDELRNKLVPINRRYPLAQLMAACRYYVEQTRRRVTFEYALIDGVNDTLGHASRLADLLKGLKAHVNLIPLNPIPEYPYQPSPQWRVEGFAQVLARRHIPHTIRLRRGLDIEAGCGQLRRRMLSSSPPASH